MVDEACDGRDEGRAAMQVIFSYDTERDECADKAAIIAEVHRRHQAPATFFCLGRLIEQRGADLRRTFDRTPELWDVHSHTYSHRILQPHRIWGDPVLADQVREEIARGVRLVREALGRPCLGLRPGCGYSAGFRGARFILDALSEHGVRFASADLCAHYGDALPADLRQPWSYADDGHPEIVELPGHGWHDCVVKTNFLRPGTAGYLTTVWPPPWPGAVPPRAVDSPEEEFALLRAMLDEGARRGVAYVAYVGHPWSVIRPQDPGASAIERTIEYCEERGWAVTSYGALREAIAREGSAALSPAPSVPPRPTPVGPRNEAGY
jgi:peptidoglycan/xylan/chitin deacetylase (PgdA/CDA1 family)